VLRDHRRFFAAWAAFALACCALAAVKVAQDRTLARREIDRNLKYMAARRAAAAVERQVPRLFYQLSNAWAKRTGPRPTPDVVERHLGVRLTRTSGPTSRGSSTYRWTDPANGVVWTLWFSDNTWANFQGNPPTAAAPPPPPVPLPFAYADVEALRAAVTRFGPYVWLIAFALMLIAATLAPRNRRAAAAWPLANALLAIGIAAVLARLLARPGPASAASAPLPPAELTIFAGMVVASALVLWLLARWSRVPPDFTRCSACDYDLTGNESGVCPECGTTCASGLQPR
jgi:hypothetical protein